MTVMITQHPGAADVECLAMDELKVDHHYYGVTTAHGVISAMWNGEVFLFFSGVGIKGYRHPSDDTKEMHWFLPVASMNNPRRLFAVKYTQTIDDKPNVIQYFRRGMSYDRALTVAQGMAVALNLKDGLPSGFLWLTCTPMEIEETIEIEEDGFKLTEDGEANDL